jgi:hypothetical protein
MLRLPELKLPLGHSPEASTVAAAKRLAEITTGFDRL